MPLLSLARPRLTTHDYYTSTDNQAHTQQDERASLLQRILGG